MNQQEHEKLTELLNNLIINERNIAEKGLHRWSKVRELITARDDIKDEILSFVESLTEK